jgi:hypothetical protein
LAIPEVGGLMGTSGIGPDSPIGGVSFILKGLIKQQIVEHVHRSEGD